MSASFLPTTQLVEHATAALRNGEVPNLTEEFAGATADLLEMVSQPLSGADRELRGLATVILDAAHTPAVTA